MIITGFDSFLAKTNSQEFFKSFAFLNTMNDKCPSSKARKQSHIYTVKRIGLFQI